MPKGQLIFISLDDEMLAGSLRLAYVFETKAAFVYVDAQTEKILKRVPLIQACFGHIHSASHTEACSHEATKPLRSVLGDADRAAFVANTFTHQTGLYPAGQRQQTFEANQNPNVQGSFILTANTPQVQNALVIRRDENQNNIDFFRDNDGTQRVTVFRFDTSDPIPDNAGDNWGVNNQPDVTTYWVAWRTYEYFRDKFGINGLDGNGGIAEAWILPQLENNAFFTRDGRRMLIGRSTFNNAFFSNVDILAHEYGHGLSKFLTTGANGTGFDFSAEPNALNEGFSDIIGKAIERHLMPDITDWQILDGLGDERLIRRMNNPLASGGPQGQPQPVVYGGNNWDTALNTSGHRNSGVLSGWFFRVATHQNMGANVDARFKNALTVAIRALDYYLFSSSNYQDVRNATIRVARNFYGGCSPQERAVVAEWNTANVRDNNYGPCFADCIANPPQIVSTSSPTICGQEVTFTLRANTAFTIWLGRPQARFSIRDPGGNTLGSANGNYVDNVDVTIRLPSSGAAFNLTAGIQPGSVGGVTCHEEKQNRAIAIQCANPCDFSSGRRRIGTFNGQEVQIRQYANGKRAIVTADLVNPGSWLADRHFPRGDNFWNNPQFQRDFGMDALQGCLNAGSTGQNGEVFPSGLTPPVGYVSGTLNGGVYFKWGSVLSVRRNIL